MQKFIRLIGLFILAVFFLSSCLPQSPSINSSVPTQKTQSLREYVDTAKAGSLTPKATSTSTITPPKFVTKTATKKPTLKKTITPSFTNNGKTKTLRPTRTPYPTFTPRNTRTASNTPQTPTAVIEESLIKVISPASLSRVVSPLPVSISVLPGYQSKVHMDLIGENGKFLIEKTWSFPNASNRRVNIIDNLPFDIQGVSESARMVIYTLDQYGRIINLQAEDIVLMSYGENDLTEPNNLEEAFAITRPTNEMEIYKGKIHIDGAFRCRKDCRLVFEVLDNQSAQLGVLELPEIYQASLEYSELNLDFQLELKKSSWARLLFHQQDVFTGEDIAVSSVVLRIFK